MFWNDQMNLHLAYVILLHIDFLDRHTLRKFREYCREFYIFAVNWDFWKQTHVGNKSKESVSKTILWSPYNYTYIFKISSQIMVV